jgi:hypothetical protein
VVSIGSGATGVVREVDARSCDAVIDALTLVASLDREPEIAPEKDRVTPPPRAPRSVDVTLGVLVDVTQIWEGSVQGAQIFGDVATTIGWLRPSARVALGRTLDSKSSATSVRVTRGAVDLCPLGWGTSFVLSACSRTELGALEIATDGDGTTRLWAATGAEARVRWLIGSRWSIDAGGGALYQLRRDDFLIGDEAAKRLPAISWTASLGAGVVLP